MSQEYGAQVILPLGISLLFLAGATAALVVWGDRRGPCRPALVNLPWPLWVLLVTLVFLAANQLLVRGAAVGVWDADGQFFPYYVLVADHARALRLAVWDPWSSGGLPILGDPQVGGVSPLNVLLGWLTGGTSAGFRSYWLLLWWLGGLGVLMLGRHLGAPPWGAAAVALGFLFNGVYTGNAEHTSWIVAFSFLPLTIWRVDVALRSGDLCPAAQAGALWGLSGLAGYPGVVIITGCFVGLWSLGRWLTSPHSTPAVASTGGRVTLRRALSCVAGVLLVGVLVLSPVYLGFFIEAAGANPRVGGLSRTVALSDELEPGAVATFASPHLTAVKAARQLMGNDAPSARLWPGTDVSMVNVYAGAIIPSLALFGLLRRPRDRWRWWLAGLAVLSLASAMGESLPLRGSLYDWLYPMRFFRHSAIFRLYYLFALTVLALLASRDLADDLALPAVPTRTSYFTASLVVSLCAALAVLPFLSAERNTGIRPNAVLLGRLHFVWLWLTLCAVSWLAWRWADQTRVWRVPVLLFALAAGDALLTSVLAMPTMVRTGRATQRWERLDSQHRSTLDLTANGWRRERSSCRLTDPGARCRLNDQLIRKVPALYVYATEKNPYLLGMVHHPVLGDMATGTERVWFSEEVAQIEASEGSFAAFRTRAELLGAPPLVIHAPRDLVRPTGSNPLGDSAGAETAVGRLPPARRIRSEIVRYLPEELVFDVRAPADGWLLVTDRWARSWQAEINGHRHLVYGGNYIFRAVPVSAGQNRVKFTYAPVGWPWLVIVSWGTLAALALWSVWRGVRPKRAEL